MKIPRNFDRWMFDYKEGNLSGSEMDYFENLINQNPQLSADVEAWDNAYTSSKNYTYPGVKNLQRQSKTPAILAWGSSIASVLIVSLLSVFYFNTTNLYNTRYSNFTAQNILYNNSNHQQHNINSSTNHIDFSQGDEFNMTTDDTDNNSTIPEHKKLIGFTNSEINPTTNNSINSENSNHKVNNDLLLVEMKKIVNEQNQYTATYQNNPKFNNNNFNFEKLSKSSYGSIRYKIKKVFRKIEKLTGYPVGLINLHDHEIMIPNANLLAINSSFAGGFGKPRFESKYRTQWLGQANSIQSTNFSFDTYAKSLRGGIGVYFNRSDVNHGALSNNSLNVIYSPKFQINSKLMFEPSVKLTMGLMQINSKKIQNNSTLEIENGRLITFDNITDYGTANNFWYKDISAGFILNHEKFYLGANASNLGQHNEDILGSNVKSNIRFEAIVGADYQSRNKKMTLSPFINYNVQNNIQNVWGGLNIKYHWLMLGGAYAIDNDFSISLGAKFKTFRLVYQYDRTTSLLMNNKFSSHTVGLRINMKQKHRR